MSWLSKLKSGLSKTSTVISAGIDKIFTGQSITPDKVEELEELLISADVGAVLSNNIANTVSKAKFNEQNLDQQIKDIVIVEICKVLKPLATPLKIEKDKPHVILLCGVNGNGKTTTAGKLASKYVRDGKKVMLVACDTFRAAAVEQLKVWANRANCKFVQGPENSDPASVAYQAIEQAKSEELDLVLIDTAGRLHNKIDLMNELAKISRILKKIDENAPHQVLLVLDATTGQNALTQVEEFKKIVQLTGLIVTKLDGTAKGGIVVSIAKKFALPIHAVGVGEAVEDLNEFEPEVFARALIS